MSVDLDYAKKVCACLPFADADAGLAETQACMSEMIAEVERLRAEVEWWHKYDSELRDNNPCPDMALRYIYLQNARKAAHTGGTQ